MHGANVTSSASLLSRAKVWLEGLPLSTRYAVLISSGRWTIGRCMTQVSTLLCARSSAQGLERNTTQHAPVNTCGHLSGPGRCAP